MSNRNIPINITWLKNETFENPLNIYQHVAYLPEFSNKSINDILQHFIKAIEKYYPNLYTRKKIAYQDDDYKLEKVSIDINNFDMSKIRRVIDAKKRNILVIKNAIKCKKAREELKKLKNLE
jgi:hypothetical protein